MSVELVVFNPQPAPRDAGAFRAWYDEQGDWDNADGMNADPSELSGPLKSWYTAMTSLYPDMTRSESEHESEIDYGLTPDLILLSMPWQIADGVETLAREKAQHFKIGTYDCMSDDGKKNSVIVFPEGPLQNEPSLFQKLFGKVSN